MISWFESWLQRGSVGGQTGGSWKTDRAMQKNAERNKVVPHRDVKLTKRYFRTFKKGLQRSSLKY